MQKKHSGFGITSFILSTAATILFFVLVFINRILETATSGDVQDNSLAMMLVGIFVIVFFILEFLALGFGVAGLLQKDRQKVFPVLGISFSSLTLVLGVALYLYGSSA